MVSVSTAAEGARRRMSELAVDDRNRFERAYERLRKAIDAYGKYLGGPLEPGRDVAVHDAQEMAAAQAEIQAAEDDLWRLREELLGWARPGSAARAERVADWFSDEDRVYDDSPATS